MGVTVISDQQAVAIQTYNMNYDQFYKENKNLNNPKGYLDYISDRQAIGVLFVLD